MILTVIIDLPNDPNASTGDFELIYECPIQQTQNIELNVDGKKILPPVKNSRKNFHYKSFSSLIIHGKKLFNPIKSCFKTQRIPMETKKFKTEKSFERKALRPVNVQRSQKQRRMLQTIRFKPPLLDDIASYVRRLPSNLQSADSKFINMNDLMRYLNID